MLKTLAEDDFCVLPTTLTTTTPATTTTTITTTTTMQRQENQATTLQWQCTKGEKVAASHAAGVGAIAIPGIHSSNRNNDNELEKLQS